MTHNPGVLLLHGPNLNMLGQRPVQHYGTLTFKELELECQHTAQELGLTLELFQSNHEGELIERVHQAYQEQVGGVLINAGAYTHTSLALADAVEILNCPVIEVHLSHVQSREPLRQVSLMAPHVKGTISGLGVMGYRLGLQALRDLIQSS